MTATLKDVSQSIRKGDWAATILRDAHLHVSIAWRVLVARQKFSVPLAPIRPQFCSSNLHDNHPAGCGYGQGKGYMIDSLFRRFPGVGLELEAFDFSHKYCLSHFRPGWILAKLKEMPSATQTEDWILVPAVGLEGVTSDASGGQDHNIFIN